jgi:hypothetical protein
MAGRVATARAELGHRVVEVALCGANREHVASGDLSVRDTVSS